MSNISISHIINLAAT